MAGLGSRDVFRELEIAWDQHLKQGRAFVHLIRFQELVEEDALHCSPKPTPAMTSYVKLMPRGPKAATRSISSVKERNSKEGFA